MKIKNCVVRIKTKDELYELENICDEHRVNWCNGVIHSNIFDNYDETVIFIDDGGLTHGSLEYYKTDYSEKLKLLSFKEFCNKYDNKGEKMKIKECIVKIRTDSELRELEDICFANNAGWSGGKKHRDMDVKNSSYDVFCVRISSILDFCSLEYYKREYSHLSFYTVNEFKKKYKKVTVTIKSKMRIKTKQDFIDEFGKRWHDHVIWNSIGEMNYLFGRHLTDDEAHEIKTRKSCYIDDWGIKPNMTIPVTTTKRKLVDLVTKKLEPMSLSISLFKRKRVRLSTSD